MIRKYVLHIEFHHGYRPRISLKRMPRTGDQTPDGSLVLCPMCQSGYLAKESVVNPWTVPSNPTKPGDVVDYNGVRYAIFEQSLKELQKMKNKIPHNT